ncbi:MAG: hypothetical protein ACR2MG_05600 [Pyrinomonadaceae bacterium]
MSDQNNLHEKSTAEMETKENLDKILKAIGEMRSDFTNRFDSLDKRVEILDKRVEKIESEQTEMKKFMDGQFEAIRQGLVKNYAQFDRLESQIAENRSVIFSTKAIVTELRENVYLLTREIKQPA